MTDYECERPTSVLLRSKDYIASEDEQLVLEMLQRASKCPYHKWCSPELIGPKRMLKPELEAEASWGSLRAEALLRVVFRDAMLFPRTSWTCFCRECAMKSPVPGKHNKFGAGFTSQHSWRSAIKAWERACRATSTKLTRKWLKSGEPTQVARDIDVIVSQ